MNPATQELDELQINCAKPECHWKGPPAEAPAHPCPTPDPAAQIAALAADPERDTLVQTLTAAGVSFDPATSIDGLRELAALTGQPQAQTEIPAVIAADADPTTREEIEEWLLAHGNYDDAGVPQNEKTATIDARLGEFLDDPEPEPEPEPELDATPETASVSVYDGDAPEEPTEAQRPPWEPAIAKALDAQEEVAAYRWLIVWKPEDVTRDAELIGRARVKKDAEGLLQNVLDRGELTGEVTIEKTQAVLEAAAEIEKRRELVEEPDRTVEPEPAPEPELEPQEPKPAPPPPEPDSRKGELFSASDYDREDLQIPKVDGHGIDRIALDFSGSIMLDRSNPDHVALFNRAKIGADLELWISAAGAGVQTKPNTNREGDLDVVVAKRSLRVETVRILAPAELENAKDEIAAQARDAHEAGEDRPAK